MPAAESPILPRMGAHSLVENRSNLRFASPSVFMRPVFRFLTPLILGSVVVAQARAQSIKVGEFASLTGKEATYGQAAHKGTILAVEEVNAAGGVLGRKIELISEDDQSKPGESATIAKKFISRDKVVAVLGEIVSGRSLEAAPICQTAHIPMISPGST